MVAKKRIVQKKTTIKSHLSVIIEIGTPVCTFRCTVYNYWLNPLCEPCSN